MTTSVRAPGEQPDAAVAALSLAARPRRGTGLLVALASGAAFGTSGTFGDGLLRAGWSPGAAVLARITVAALVLTPVALPRLRDQRTALRQNVRQVLVYGLVGVLGCTFCYFDAIATIPVGVGLLLEYTAAIMVVAWLWLRHGQRPRWLTITGTAAAIGGLALMAGITGSGGLNLTGFAWGMAAAVCMTVFMFVCDSPAPPTPDGLAAADELATSGEPAPGNPAPAGLSPTELSPVVLSWAGICVAAVALAILGAAHVIPLAASTSDVILLSDRVSWILPVLAVGILSTAVAYIAAVAAVRSLGAKLATFIGMSEILFAAAFAWLMLGQVPTPVQLAGSGLIVAGVLLIRVDER
jgi:drug/metabolite transporter (DMT)-like permease